MPKEKQRRPRLLAILTVLLITQTVALVVLGLNLLTDQWFFLTTWARFWEELISAIRLVIQYPGVRALDDYLVQDVLAFAILIISAAASLIAGVNFQRGKAITWIVALIAQIGTLTSGLVLYFVHQPSQSYWLLVIGIIMVVYLNYGNIRQWFLQPVSTGMEGDDV